MVSTPIPVWLHTPSLPQELHGQVWCPIPMLRPWKQKWRQCRHHLAPTEPLRNPSPWRSYSHRSRGGVAPRYSEGVLTQREGGVGGKGSGRTMERPLKIGTCSGVVQTRWSTPLWREDLCSGKSGACWIMSQHHDTRVASHAGRWKTLELVAHNYWWLQMSHYIGQYVKSCDLCLWTKAQCWPLIRELAPLPVLEFRWDTIRVDFIVKLLESHGYDAVMNVVDSMSKMSHFILTHTTITALRAARL